MALLSGLLNLFSLAKPDPQAVKDKAEKLVETKKDKEDKEDKEEILFPTDTMWQGVVKTYKQPEAIKKMYDISPELRLANFLVRAYEDFSEVPYKDGDSESVGYGFYKKRFKDDPRLKPVFERKTILTKDKGAEILDEVLTGPNRTEVRNTFKNRTIDYSKLDPYRRAVIMSFNYQLGQPKLGKLFNRAITLSKSRDLDKVVKKFADIMRVEAEPYKYSKDAKGVYTRWNEQADILEADDPKKALKDLMQTLLDRKKALP